MALCAAALAACAPLPTPTDHALADVAAACTERHAFDPAARGLPERALAPGEAAWNACVREAVGDASADGPLAGAWRRLLAEHARLEVALGRGSISRSQLRLELRAAIAALDRARRDEADRVMESAMAAHNRGEWQRQLKAIRRPEIERALLGY